MQKKSYRRPQSSKVATSAQRVASSLFESLESRTLLSAAPQLLAADLEAAAAHYQPMAARAAAAQPVVTVTALRPKVSEAAGTGYFELARTGDTSKALTVKLTVGGTATNGRDYDPIASTITFEAGKAKAYIAVKAMEDTRIERPESIAIAVAAGTGYTPGTGYASMRIIDNDCPTVAVSVPQGTIISEDSSMPAVFTFSRTGALTTPVTINFTLKGRAVNGADYQTIQRSVTIPKGKTNVKLYVNAIDDLNAEIDEYIDIRISGGYYNANPNYSRAFVKLQDNDTAQAGMDFVTFRGPATAEGDSYILRVPATGGVPTNLSQAMTRLGKAGKDFGVAVSADGQYMLLKTSRFNGDATGSLALVPTSNLAAGQQVVIDSAKIAPVDGNIAIANTADKIVAVYAVAEGATIELYAATFTKATSTWTKARITDGVDTTYKYKLQPAISADGTKVLFAAGNTAGEHGTTAILEVNADGTGQRLVVDNSTATNATAYLEFPKYNPAGGIVFGSNWNNQHQIFQKAGDADPVEALADTTNEFSPAVLANGSVISLYRDRFNDDAAGITELALHGTVLQILLPGTELPLQSPSVSA